MSAEEHQENPSAWCIRDWYEIQDQEYPRPFRVSHDGRRSIREIHEVDFALYVRTLLYLRDHLLGVLSVWQPAVPLHPGDVAMKFFDMANLGPRGLHVNIRKNDGGSLWISFCKCGHFCTCQWTYERCCACLGAHSHCLETTR